MASDVEKQLFSERLHKALHQAGVRPAGPSVVARRFNLLYDGEPVTPQATRKWLEGLSIPNHDKMLVLARWLKVSPSWLGFGEDPSAPNSKAGVAETAAARYGTADLGTLIELLDEKDRETTTRMVLGLLALSGKL